MLSKNENIKVVGYDKTINQAIDKLKDCRGDIDTILLIDQGVNTGPSEFLKLINSFKELFLGPLRDTQFKFVTKEPQFQQAFIQAAGDRWNFKAYFIDKIKIPMSLLEEICCEKLENTGETGDAPFEETETSVIKKKRSFPFFGRNSASIKEQSFKEPQTNVEFQKDDRAQTHYSSKPILIPGNLNRVIAVTGHRGSGVTGTVANIAVEASMQGLKTMVIDLDTSFRGINLYFSKFGEEVDLNPDLAASLVKCLLKPDSYIMNSCRINENLSIITMAYSVDSDDKLMDFINIRRILTLVTTLKPKFNSIILDLPLEYFKEYAELLIHLDTIGLCVNNSLYSIINTAKGIGDTFTKEDLTVFHMKSKLVLTKYNDNNRHQGKKLTPEFTCEILNEIGEILEDRLDCAGIIPYTREFDYQVETGKKLCTYNKEYKNYYLNVLKNLL
jgi:septum formation inhibitor-activating ATPase MinD